MYVSAGKPDHTYGVDGVTLGTSGNGQGNQAHHHEWRRERHCVVPHTFTAL